MLDALSARPASRCGCNSRRLPAAGPISAHISNEARCRHWYGGGSVAFTAVLEESPCYSICSPLAGRDQLPMPGAGDFAVGHRVRIAHEQEQELERKQQELLEQISERNTPAQRILVSSVATA
jgi:hypothetical protein